MNPTPVQSFANLRDGLSAEMDRAYQTRDGRKVTLYCVNAPGLYPAHGRIENDPEPHAWTDLGESLPASGKTPDDLIEVPPPAPEKWEIHGWVNMYAVAANGLEPIGYIHVTREAAEAMKMNNPRRIACMPLVLAGNVGEGLAS